MLTRKLLVATGTVLTVSAIFAGHASSSTGDDEDPVIRGTAHVLTLVVRPIDPKGLSVGDPVTYRNRIDDLSGKQIATSNGFCTVLALAGQQPSLLHCYELIHFAQGDIFTVYELDLASRTVQHAGIGGGTGEFKRARGQIDFTLTSPTTTDSTYRIER
jgi:hypothetical protein